MHETSEYYCYINLCNLESDTLVYFLFYSKHNISLIIHNLHKICLHIYDNNHLNANPNYPKINQNFNIFRIINIIVEFRDAI